jgi:hypothetical protein
VNPALALSVVAANLVGCATHNEIAETERKIVEARKTLTLREQQIGEKSPASLAPAMQLEAEIRYRPIQSWLNETTNTGFTITVIGVSSLGDIAYSPGIGKAWLEPARDARGFSRLQGVVLGGMVGTLNWSAQFQAEIEARAKFSILGVGGNVKCSGALPSTPVLGDFAVGTPTGVALPYRMTIGSGNRLSLRAGCGLGALGTIYLDFPLGTVAGESAGTFDIGLRQSGEVSIPGDQVTKLKYTVNLLRPEVSLAEHALIVKSDVELKLERQGALK